MARNIGDDARLELPFVELLHAASREVSAIFEGQLRHDTITARQAMAMLILEEHPQVVQRDLAALLYMDRSSLSVMIRRMESTGMIVRHHENGDARAWRIELTKRGRANLPRVRQAMTETMEVVRERIGGDVTAHTRTALRRLLRSTAG